MLFPSRIIASIAVSGVIFLSASPLSATDTSSIGKHCLWRITNAPAPFYLLGSVHALQRSGRRRGISLGQLMVSKQWMNTFTSSLICTRSKVRCTCSRLSFTRGKPQSNFEETSRHGNREMRRGFTRCTSQSSKKHRQSGGGCLIGGMQSGSPRSKLRSNQVSQH